MDAWFELDRLTLPKMHVQSAITPGSIFIISIFVNKLFRHDPRKSWTYLNFLYFVSQHMAYARAYVLYKCMY